MSEPVKHRETALPEGLTLPMSAVAIDNAKAGGVSRLAAAPTLRVLLETAGSLSKAERLLLVEQALLMLERFYVHRPLKEAMHAIRPLQRLKVLQYHLEQTPEAELPSELRFHNEMLEIFLSLRDLHTNYLLPTPYKGKFAFLPFLVEEYFEDGKRKYMVSKLIQGFSHPTLVPGVEVLYWNGVPIERAIELNADQTAGSNRDARHARGLDALTLRPLIVSPPPDAEWVVMGYRTSNGEEHEIRQEWLIGPPDADATAIEGLPRGIARQAASGLDIQADEVRQAKQILFAPEVVEEAARLTVGRIPSAGTLVGMEPHQVTHEAALGIDIQADEVRQAKQMLFAPEVVAKAITQAGNGEAPAAGDDVIASRMPLVLNARAVETSSGTFGYIRIFTFNVPDADAFVTEFVRLSALLPQNGLIVDVRGNGGGLIFAGERLLQVLTPGAIEPEPVQFIMTPLTLDLCRRHGVSSPVDLSPWRESMEQAVTTGAMYSRSFPITSKDSCNAIGQQYVGPVVLITDATCYSTTDIFAAGFQDHKIGRILGTSGNTGAGGANVWTHELLQILFSGGNSPFKNLPRGAGMRVAIRQTLRVGPQSGTLLEDLGVVPDERYQMTKNDVLHDNVGLINRAGQLLAEMPMYELTVKVGPRAEGKVAVVAQTRNINRLDFFIDDRPKESLDVRDGEIPFTVPLPATGKTVLLLRGYDGQTCVAARREEL